MGLNDNNALKKLKLLISQIDKKINVKKLNMDKYKKYTDSLYLEVNSDSAIFKLLNDYLTLIKQSPDLSIEDDINVKAFLSGTLMSRNIKVFERGITRVLIEYVEKDKDGNEEIIPILLHFEVYLDNRNVLNHYIIISSELETTISGTFIYEHLLSKAIKRSDIKGKQLSMYKNQLAWDVTELTPRSFNDIFLPNKISNELRLYKKVFTKQGHLMRYLMVGIPGTGKTESTLVLSNEMIKKGVTIIKTSICEAFKDKVKLAQLLSPSLIILDDIDLSLGSRNKGGISPLLHSFLDVLDGTEKIEGNVGILATTNSVALLDIAARRPGRFDKTILFDGITKSNIRDIIKKSLKSNFDVETPDEFIGDEILKLYYEKKLTGSHIFNITELLYRKLLIEFQKDLTKLTEKWVIQNINHEIKIVDQVKNFNSEITETFTSSTSQIGLGFSADNDLDDEVELYDDEVDDEVDDEAIYLDTDYLDIVGESKRERRAD